MTVSRPTPLFLGYALKSALCPNNWTEDPRVKEICSVSECIAGRPKGWNDPWDFNRAGYYATRAAALATAPDVNPIPLHLFAYEFFPLRFESAGAVSAIDPLDVFGGPLEPAPDFTPLSNSIFLGYDAVARWSERTPGDVWPNCFAGGFGCSPLSCNSLAPSYPVNRFCLLDRWDDVVAAAIAFAREQPEPGCYYIFGVWRKGVE